MGTATSEGQLPARSLMMMMMMMILMILMKMTMVTMMISMNMTGSLR